MEYKNILSNKTLSNLDKKSKEHLKQMLGDRSIIQTISSSNSLLSEIAEAEKPYIKELEKLALDIIYELYPILKSLGIKIDAQITSLSDTTNSLDEIKYNAPKTWNLDKFIPDLDLDKVKFKDIIKYNNEKYLVGKTTSSFIFYINLNTKEKGWFHKISLYTDNKKLSKISLSESLSPESRRRLINAITQGAALRGAFAFHLFKEALDKINPSLVEKYNQIMKNSFGIYDDENAIALLLSLLAQGHKAAGGTSKVIISEIKFQKPNTLEKYVLYKIKQIFPDAYLAKDWLNREGYFRIFFYKKEKQIINIDNISYNADQKKYNVALGAHDLHGRNFKYLDNALEYLKTKKQNLDNFIPEIKVLNPLLKSPLKINSQEEWDRIWPILKKKNYRWGDGTELDNFFSSSHDFPQYVVVNPDKTIIIDDSEFPNENNPSQIFESKSSNITIKARAICFPMLIHEIIKGLYELISLQGFRGDKESNQKVVDKIDTLQNEPHDIKYGKFIYDALNNLFASSQYNDPRIREFFFAEVYKLEDNDFISLIENSINEELTPKQRKWVDSILKEISLDLRNDDYDETGLDEIKFNPFNYKINPQTKLVQSKISTTYLGKNEIYALVDLGSYYTVVPYGNQNTAPLFPKQYFSSLEDTYSTSQILTPDEVEFLTNLLKSGKYFIHKKSPKPLKEYNEKTIKNTIERWKQENPEVEENSARQLISRFDQIKSSLSQKLDIVSLSDELKKNNNYLNIDKYSYEDMMNLIKSLPENPDKVKKEAIKNFIEREEIDKNLAASYVARFMNKREELKYATENGTENGAFSKEEVINYIPKRLLRNKAFMDPRLWKFSDMESMLDAIFPSYRKISDDEENIAETDADKIYDKNGIEIYKGDDINKCIRYNPTDSKSKTKYYGWCVSQPGNTNYDYYRFRDTSPTFYFVFDREKTSEKKSSGFVDPWHAFVLQVNKDNESYVITNANNRGDESVDSWSNIKKIVPPETWNKIKDLKEYFKSIPLSGVERGRKFASGKNLSLDEFKELNQEEKIQYIQGKASKNQISDEILKILPKYKISYEGRTTTLANVAIDSGQKFDYDSLKDHESLAKRYAIFRFRHTDYGEDPIPLPFIKFLDNEAKQKYFKRFEEDYLNYSLTKKFFGDEILIDFINKKSKEFEYIQPEYIKYISDNNIKKIYELYSKLTQNWSLTFEKDLSEDNLNKIKTMPEQTISPVPITYKQWKSLSNSEKNLTVDLIEKLNNNPKYKTLLYALPYLILDKDTKYILLPEKANNYYYPEWILSEISGKIVKSSISGDLFLGENYLSSGFPDETSEGSINRIFKLSDLKKL